MGEGREGRHALVERKDDDCSYPGCFGCQASENEDAGPDHGPDAHHCRVEKAKLGGR